MHLHPTTPAPIWPDASWPTPQPAESEPGSLLGQLSALVYFHTRTDTHTPAELRWDESRFYCLPHVHNHHGSVIEEVGR